MIRFVDLRFTGCQARFAFYDTVCDMFEKWSEGRHAWALWEDFEEDLLRVAPRSYLERRKNLCPEWVFQLPTEEELGLKEE